MIKRYSIVLLFITTAYTQTVIGEGLSGQPLLDYVVSNYKTNTTLGYNNARDILYGTIDLQQGNQLSCVYSGYTITLDTSQDPSTNAYQQGINCEHTWPQSMGAGQEPQRSDMHHLFPCKSNVNSSRGNDPFGEIPDENTDIWYRNEYSQGTIPTIYIEEYAEKYNPNDPSDELFEPREDHKGDASRAMFYFYAMYNDAADTTFWNIQKDNLLYWHYYDPVDEWEENRTWAISGYQENNPNPFVLDSTLARRIWFYSPIVSSPFPRELPVSFQLGNPYPNPFNGEVTWEINQHYPLSCVISVFNLNGQKVETLWSGVLKTGQHYFKWVPRNQSSGIYFIEVKFDLSVSRIKAVYLK